MKYRATFLAGLLWITLTFGVWAGPAVSAVDHVPQRVLLGMTADPAHSQSVTWRSQAVVATPQAQWAAWSADPGFPSTATTVKAESAEYTTGDGANVTHYTALFENMEPGKEYAYRVGDGTVWSEWYHFRTASVQPDRFRFLFLGDAQVDVKSLWSRVAHAAYLKAPDARFVLHAGDLIKDGWNDVLWGEWCEGLGFMGAWLPQIATPGNHDMNVPENSSQKPVAAFPLWRAHLALPMNGPENASMLSEETYYFDYQGVRFISLEGNAYSPEEYDPEARNTVQKVQAAWLEKILSDNPNRWTIMLHHEPMYGVGKNPDNPELREAFLPLYDKYHVDLVLQGHDHVYTRTPKLEGGKVVDPGAPGTVYVTSVSGPRMYPFNKKYETLMAKIQQNTQMYQVVEVDGERLRFEAYAVTGEPIDGFELRKKTKDATTLTEITGSKK